MSLASDIQLLSEAEQEIHRLRHRISIAEGQLAIVEVFAAVVGLRRPDQGMVAADIAWQLQRRREEMADQSLTETMDQHPEAD